SGSGEFGREIRGTEESHARPGRPSMAACEEALDRSHPGDDKAPSSGRKSRGTERRIDACRPRRDRECLFTDQDRRGAVSGIPREAGWPLSGIGRRQKMKTIRYGLLALLFVSACAMSQTSRSDKERLIGAWHLISMAGPDGKPLTTDVPSGMLIYTRDGHV